MNGILCLLVDKGAVKLDKCVFWWLEKAACEDFSKGARELERVSFEWVGAFFRAAYEGSSFYGEGLRGILS